MISPRHSLGIEGIPFIIRFKTQLGEWFEAIEQGIEGIPFIIRFKTSYLSDLNHKLNDSIEGIPFIIRFKTLPFFQLSC